MFFYNLKHNLWNRISNTDLEGCFEKPLIDWYSEGSFLVLMGPLWSQLYNKIIIRIIHITVFCIIPSLTELLGFVWAAFFPGDKFVAFS